MPIPAGVETVTVTDGGVPLTGPDGTPLEGSFTVVGPDLATVKEDDYLFGGGAKRWVRAGLFDPLTLVATDADGIDPAGFTYTVVFTPQYGTAWTRYLSLPKASPSVVLADILIPDPATGSHAVLVEPSDLLARAANLDDVADKASARSNLGLGNAAVANIGTAPGTVAAGDDSRLSDARNPSAHAASHAADGGDPVALSQSQVTGLPGALGALLPKAGGSVTGDLDVEGRLSTAGFALPAVVPFTPRPAYREASWAQLFQAGHGWGASGSGVASSNANDTTLYSKGTQSFKVTTTGTGAVANIRRLGSALPDLTGKALRITLRIADVTHLNQINVQVGSSSLTNYFQWRLTTHSAPAENQILSGEWAVITLSWADVRSAAGSYSLSSTGVPSTMSGFTDLLIQTVDDNTGNPLTMNLQSIEVIGDTSETFPNGVVSITFDDSYASQFTQARPGLDARGYRGTLYTICDVIGTAGYLTLDQLQTVQAASGWEVAGHAYSVALHNAKYHTLTAAQVEDDVRRARRWMLSNGFHSDSFAYPGGFFSRTSDGASIEALTCRYFGNGRGISSADTLEPFPPPMPYRIRSISGIGAMAGGAARGYTANLVGAGGALDRCQLSGNWVVLTFHEITTGAAANANQCSVTDFNTIMDAIAARGIPVRTVGEVLRHYS